MKIYNCSELWRLWVSGENESEARAQKLLEKCIFKASECGCVFGVAENGVFVGGYAEGSDAELPLHHLDWGFTIKEFSEVLEAADKEGVEEWHLANDEDLARVVDEDDWSEAYASLDKITEEEWLEENNKSDA